MELQDRKMKILQAIIRNYLETGEPYHPQLPGDRRAGRQQDDFQVHRSQAEQCNDQK